MSNHLYDSLIEIMSLPKMLNDAKFVDNVKDENTCHFSTTFELAFEKSHAEYVVSSKLTYMDTNWTLKFYPNGCCSGQVIEDCPELASIAICFLGGGGGEVVADCSLTILNHKHANLNIVKEFKDVVFTKSFPKNSVGFSTSASALMHSKYGYFANGLLSVKADVCIKSIADSAKDYKLSSQLSTLLFDDSTADLAIFVGYEQIAAHKVILAARSAVFKDIFAHSDADCAISEYVVSDFDAFVVRTFLSFVYKDAIDSYSLGLHARELFAMASRYQVHSLIAVCEEHLSSTLSVETAVELLLLASEHHNESLQSDALDFLVRHFSAVFRKGGVAERLGVRLCEEVFKAVAGRVVLIRDAPRIVD